MTRKGASRGARECVLTPDALWKPICAICKNAELAKHISKITLTPREAIYVGVGDWHLCISWAWSLTIVPEEGIGQNVCLFASSGWRQPDPCCYESHKN
jgi:hypothetical protein